MTDHSIELGKKAKDIVSGWEGLATARYEYMNGCIRYEISAQDKDGQPKSFVFDEQQLEQLTDEKIKKPGKSKRTGGERGRDPVSR